MMKDWLKDWLVGWMDERSHVDPMKRFVKSSNLFLSTPSNSKSGSLAIFTFPPKKPCESVNLSTRKDTCPTPVPKLPFSPKALIFRDCLEFRRKVACGEGMHRGCSEGGLCCHGREREMIMPILRFILPSYWIQVLPRVFVSCKEIILILFLFLFLFLFFLLIYRSRSKPYPSICHIRIYHSPFPCLL